VTTLWILLIISVLAIALLSAAIGSLLALIFNPLTKHSLFTWLFIGQACCAFVAGIAHWYTLCRQNGREDKLNNLVNDIGHGGLVKTIKNDSA